MRDLTGGDYQHSDYVHLDPDINRPALQSRDADWRGLFGQGFPQASGHLLNHSVGIGDVFLFFGLYQYVEQAGRTWRYMRGSQSFHASLGLAASRRRSRP